MPSLLSKILRKIEGEQKPPPLPLPPNGPVDIVTPASLADRAAIANSPLFQRLPSEIRRLILIEAFGDRGLHVDLSLEYPTTQQHHHHHHSKLTSHEALTATEPLHANVHLLRDKHRHQHTNKPRRWEWWGCVCHRSMRSWKTPADVLPWMDPPSEDSCRNPYQEQYCTYLPAKIPCTCNIGALGWLLTCRQAYVEGIDVLYGTNTLHINKTYLCRSLPDLFPSTILRKIRAVELLWALNPWDKAGKEDKFPPDPNMVEFEAMLDALPATLPNLKHLYLSLHGDLMPPGASINSQKLTDCTQSLLRLVDAMVSRFDKLEEGRVALPFTLLLTVNTEFARRVPMYDWLFGVENIPGPVWRHLPDDLVRERGGKRIKGYWVCLGKRDVGTYYIRESS